MNYAVIIIMFGGLHDDTILVMDEDKGRCGDKAEMIFEQTCQEKNLRYTEEEMQAYKDEGYVAVSNYDIYLTWPTVEK